MFLKMIEKYTKKHNQNKSAKKKKKTKTLIKTIN